jgi:hypothetical protein
MRRRRRRKRRRRRARGHCGLHATTGAVESVLIELILLQPNRTDKDYQNKTFELLAPP